MNVKTNQSLVSLFLLFLLTFSSCQWLKKDNTNPQKLAELTTTAATNIQGNEVTLGGNVTNSGNVDIIKRGICWSLNPNPTIQANNFIEEYNNTSGYFSFTLIDKLEQNKVYYARAYCQNQIGIQYGNEISFSTQSVISILAISNIVNTQATLKGSFTETDNVDHSTVGFVYDKSPNPTINNSQVSKYIQGSDDFELNIAYLSPNTTYYVRAYTIKPRGGYLYSEQQQFRTTGYYGPAGGYVVYDKGDTTGGGWRYLEVYPVSLNADNNNYGAAWSTSNTFISGTLPDIGKGLENTKLIINNTTQTNCAAKLCDNFTVNGYSDWFLPSSQEMLTIANNVVISVNNAWTSTQQSQSEAYYISTKDIYTGQFPILTYDKKYSKNVYPTRRY